MKTDNDIHLAVQTLREGGFVALLDHPEREGEADLLLAAQHATGERINTMINDARGLITLATVASRLAELDIPLLEPRFCGENYPHLACPVDYTIGTTTGVSAYDRAATARAFTDPGARPEHFARPGHLMPLAGAEGGIAQRGGHTEGALGLAHAAGLYPAVVMCEMLAEDGHMARGEELVRLCRLLGHPMISVEEVARYLETLAD